MNFDEFPTEILEIPEIAKMSSIKKLRFWSILTFFANFFLSFWRVFFPKSHQFGRLLNDFDDFQGSISKLDFDVLKQFDDFFTEIPEISLKNWILSILTNFSTKIPEITSIQKLNFVNFSVKIQKFSKIFKLNFVDFDEFFD